MTERGIPRLSNGRLHPAYARALRAYADPEENDISLHYDALTTIAPDKKRPSFQRDVLHPLLVMGISDLAKKVNDQGGVPPEKLFPLPDERTEGQLFHLGFQTGAYLNSLADFPASFMLEPEQEVRFARYTVWGKEPELEEFQRDSVETFFSMTNIMMISIVQKALENGFINEDEIDLALYADILRMPWFKKIILGSMDTGNGFWADPTPNIDTIKFDGIDAVVERAEEITSWWNVKGPLPEGPVSVSPVLRVALEDRKVEQQAARTPSLGTGFLTENLPTDGCPIRHAKAVYSEDPNDINFLSEAQVARLTEGEIPLAVRDTNSPNILHVRFSINSFLLDQYAKALEKVA